MQRFQKGETVVLEAVLRDGQGQLFSALGGVEVEIKDSKGNAVLEATQMDHVGEGMYRLEIQTAAQEYVAGTYLVISRATHGTQVVVNWDRFRIEEVPSS